MKFKRNSVYLCLIFYLGQFCSEGWSTISPRKWTPLSKPNLFKNMKRGGGIIQKAKQRYIDELSKGELFSQLQDSAHGTHDDVVLRSSWWGGKYSIPQAERYKGEDWVKILLATPSSQVLRRIKHPLLINMIWSLIVAGLQNQFNFPSKSSLAIHSLLGTGMGLLLVFRNNAAYQRYWEGRTIWEGILGDARSLSRLIMLFRKELGVVKVKRIANLICAFPYILSEHLGARTTENYSHLVTRNDLVLLNRIGNRPLGIINILALELRQIQDKKPSSTCIGGFAARERLAMLVIVDKLTKAIGACERLVQTPVPLTYARHTSRFLSLWCLTLPIALCGDFGWLTIPAMAVVSWALFGIQEIGLMIEEPFRKELRLDIVTQTIYADVQETCFMHGVEWGNPISEEGRSSSDTIDNEPMVDSNLTTSSNFTGNLTDTIPWLMLGTWPWQQTAPWPAG